MLSRRRVVTALGLFLFVATQHLVWQLLGVTTMARLSQWLLVPALACLLALGTVGPERRPRLVRLTLLALGFSWLGDAAPSLTDGDAAFLVMVGFFLVAQATYILAFCPYRTRSVLDRRRVLLVPYALVVGALVVACAPHAGPLLVPVLLYGLLLGTMAVLATGLNALVWAGGALFLVSDGLIATEAFAPWWALPQQGFWVMLTYILAQLLLVLGVLRTRERLTGAAH